MDRPGSLPTHPLIAATSQHNETPRKWYSGVLRVLPLKPSFQRQADGDRSSSPTASMYGRWTISLAITKEKGIVVGDLLHKSDVVHSHIVINGGNL
ncbi:unnamed protein product [Sympodiomycopsis kandeliae]